MKYKFQQSKIKLSMDASVIFRIHLLIVYSYSWKIRISIPCCNKIPQCHMILSLPSRRKPFYGQVFVFSEKLLKSNLKVWEEFLVSPSKLPLIEFYMKDEMHKKDTECTVNIWLSFNLMVVSKFIFELFTD